MSELGSGMDRIKLIGLDPALRNIGIAVGEYYLRNDVVRMQEIKLLTSENDKSKLVRRNSDDLRRARELNDGVQKMIAQHECKFLIAEVPTGTQSARGAMSNGIMIGLLAASSIPVIEVLPHEVKFAAVGHKFAAKQEMIEWAMARYPHLPWRKRKSKGVAVATADNEHLADACATIEAGILTEQFRNIVAVYKSLLTATPIAA
jgi:Holliday junction resolvasome RuvABC endonuclease subunit